MQSYNPAPVWSQVANSWHGLFSTQALISTQDVSLRLNPELHEQSFSNLEPEGLLELAGQSPQAALLRAEALYFPATQTDTLLPLPV